MSVNIYLNFLGNTEEAFNFYKSIFGGEFDMVSRFSDTPHANDMPEGDRHKIMHISLPLGKHMTLMGTDALESMGHKLIVGNNVNISLHPETKEEADRLFKALSEGGEVEMPLQDTFWGAYFASFGDKFGIKWMINYEYPQNG